MVLSCACVPVSGAGLLNAHANPLVRRRFCASAGSGILQRLTPSPPLPLTMRYISTRDARPPPHRASYSFIDAVLQGLAPDGGLLVPEAFPLVSSEEWLQWRHLEYNDLCFCVLRKFIDVDEVTDAELNSMIAAA